MPVSVNANIGAMLVLKNLNATASDLTQAQGRIASGLAVASAKDSPAIHAAASNMRSEVSVMSALSMGLRRASSILDVGMTAGHSISDLLNQLKEKALTGADAGLDAAARSALQADFAALVSQIQNIAGNAVFDGVNLLDGSLAPGGVPVMTDSEGGSSIALLPETLTPGGLIVTVGGLNDLLSPANAAAALAAVDASRGNVNAALARMSATSKKVDAQAGFVLKLQDSLRAGAGALVDADMAAESARLQALQIKQQLGAQALAIANSTPQLVLGLFRNA